MQFITSSASTGPAEDLGVHLQLGQSERFQVFLNHEKQWRTFSFNLNRELKMKYWYFAQLELQFRQLQSLSFSIFKQQMHFCFLKNGIKWVSRAQHQIIY
ncbi:Hypothetical_protein [Hexamita inflata]|uniref:Hypothetical_protein n=1 Tax=Hexamita inflata TaxID=28002 RepID=A0AA86N8P7_9EUKA|nr:Hypothetical protein HINF_LOCUS2515 [Hexamita inflata]